MTTDKTDIFILRGFRTDFARNDAEQGLEISDLVGDVVAGTPGDAGIDADSDIETIHVANAFGRLFNGQGQLGGMPAPRSTR